MRLLLLIAVSFLISKPLRADWQLVCPGDITVSCTVNYANLDQFGKAYVDYNGSIIWIKDCKVTYDINDCGYGTITRVWGAEDPDWKWVTCTQIITLSNADAFGEKDITWPSDLTIQSCNPEAELKQLYKPYDRPYWKTNKCSRPMLNSSDMRFRVSDGCVKLVRTWKILDWCVYDPYKNPLAGIFSHVQVIKLITVDSAAHISCPRDSVVLAVNDCKGARIKLDSARVFSPCNMPFVIHNTSTAADTNTADASGFYPIGKHSFYYVAEYGCGKEIKCNVNIEVRRAIPPVPYCKDGVILDLMPADTDGDGKIDNGMIEVWANDLDHGSYHPCTHEKLHFSFSKDIADRSRIFTCKEIGDNEVEIWVTDSLGNADLCKTKVIIQNNTGIPDCKKPDSLTKKTFDLSVHLSDWFSSRDYNNVMLLAAPLTGGNMSQGQGAGPGQYHFNQLLKQTDYHFIFGPSSWPRPGIKDLQWLDRYLHHTLSHVSPYQIVAADLDGNAVVDQADFDLLQRQVNGRVWTRTTRALMIPQGLQLGDGERALMEYKQLDMSIRSVSEDNMEKSYWIIPAGVFYDYSGLDEDGAQFLKMNATATQSLNCYSSGGNLIIEHNAELTNVSGSDISVFDMLGKQIISQPITPSQNTLMLNQVNLPKGLYIVVVGNQKQMILID